MSKSDIDSIRNFIKGKIAEDIFELMFREGSDFTVVPFGYENSFPEIAQYESHVALKSVIQTLKRMPDFALISSDKKEVFIVEVKYRSRINLDELNKIAEDTLKYWDHSWLFLATPHEFYFEPCHRFINNGGRLEKLSKRWIKDDEIYHKYLKLLNEFELTGSIK